MRDGVFIGFVGVYEDEEEVLAASNYIGAPWIWSVDCADQWICDRTVYLHPVLGRYGQSLQKRGISHRAAKGADKIRRDQHN